MEQTNVNSGGTCAVSTSRVPFVELVTPFRHISVELADLATGAGAFALRVFAAIRRRRAINQTIRELRALDDHILRDIGIERSQIVSVAMAQVDGPRTRR